MKKILVMIMLSVTTAYATDKSYDYYLPSIIEQDQAHFSESGHIGHAYSTDKDKAYASGCLNESPPTLVGDNRGSLTVSDEYSFSELKRHFSVDINGRIGRPWFYASMLTRFVRESSESEYTRNFTYLVEMRFKDLQFNEPPDDQDILNRAGRGHQPNPARFREYCGDQYIAQHQRGAFLLVQLRMNFYNSSNKREFMQRVGFRVPLVKLMATIRDNVHKLREEGNISVRAIQVGGDQTELGRVLGAPSPGEPAPILECRFNNLDKCQQMLNNVITYATVKEEPNFPAQLEEDGSDRRGPAIIKRIKQDYEHLGIIIESDSIVTPDIKKAREDLAKKYSEITDDMKRVDYLLELIQAPGQIEKLLDVKVKLSFNEDSIQSAGMSCFDVPEICVVQKNEAFSNLRKFDRSILEQNGDSWKIIAKDPRSNDECKIVWDYNSETDDVIYYDIANYCDGDTIHYSVGELWQDGDEFFMESTYDIYTDIYHGKYLSDKKLEGRHVGSMKAQSSANKVVPYYTIQGDLDEE